MHLQARFLAARSLVSGTHKPFSRTLPQGNVCIFVGTVAESAGSPHLGANLQFLAGAANLEHDLRGPLVD